MNNCISGSKFHDRSVDKNKYFAKINKTSLVFTNRQECFSGHVRNALVCVPGAIIL